MSEFLDAIRAAGLTPPDVIEPGKIHRFPGIGKHANNRAGWCRLFDDGLGGAFGDFASDFSENWHAKRAAPFTRAEREAFNRQVSEARAQAEVERRDKYAEAGKKAAHIWNVAIPAPADHGYLVSKKIGPHELRIYKNHLLVPVLNDTLSLTSLQFINGDGAKKFLMGGEIAGGFGCIAGELDHTVYIAEGFATGASVAEATRCPTYLAFSAGNMAAAALMVRRLHPDVAIVVCADNDIGTDGNPGVAKATKAAAAIGAPVAIPQLGGERCDFNDVHLRANLIEVRRQLELAGDETFKIPPKADIETDDQTVARLAKLDAIAYARVRKTEAVRMQINVAALDKAVKAAHQKPLADELTGTAPEFAAVAPAAAPVDGAQLLDALVAVIGRHVIVPKHAEVAIALWIVLTYLLDVVDTAPILAATSPEKRCGKTTLESLISKLAFRALTASNITPAALFRCMDAWTPTLIVDEADAFLKGNEELRGILNSGHTRATAYVIRCVGDDSEPRRFSTWGAKTVALIGKLPDTLTDRSVVIQLRRKLPSECVEKLRRGETALFDTLRGQIARWVADNRAAIRQAHPAIPGDLHDRAADNWQPLLSIAGAAGGKWAEHSRVAASALTGASPDNDSVKVELLAECRDIFERLAVDRIGSEHLVNVLTEDKSTRWAEYYKGKAITQRQVAHLLGSFGGIVPGTVRLPDGKTPKGYRLEQFLDAFSRYLPHTLPFQPQQRHNQVSMRVSEENSSATGVGVWRTEGPPQLSTSAACGDVADKKPSPYEDTEGFL